MNNEGIFTNIDSELYSLEQMNKDLNSLVTDQCNWEILHTVVPKLANKLNFQAIVDAAPTMPTYYRHPIVASDCEICLTLFVFKRSDHPGAAVLLHTYASATPNGKLFDASKVLNPPEQIEQFNSTPIHNHTVNCHSYIALTVGAVSVYEQHYARHEEGLVLLANTHRPVGSCVLDDTHGEYIHSVSVRFT